MDNFIKTKLNKFHLYRYLAQMKHKHDVLKDPKKEANRVYKSIFKKEINFDNPKNLIEKTFWLQFNTDTSLWTKYADKYCVRDYIRECGYEEHLPTLYGKWDYSNQIDFENLPNSFVLKTNNGCETIIIVKDKTKINYRKIRRTLNRWLHIPFGYNGAQLHYTKIKPCVIAEEYLTDYNKLGTSLIDYKIWCLNGQPLCIGVYFDRFSKTGVKVSLFDLDWNNISEKYLTRNSNRYSGIDFPKPKSFVKMLEIAKVLSGDFPQVRVDFYDIGGKPYFSEMTFTAGFGSYTEEFYNYLGSKIDLNIVEINNQ